MLDDVRRLALLIPLALSPACSDGGPERPVPDHVLLIVVDTLRADHLGCYGHPRAPTPAMDAVAAGGVRFADAVAQGSWTAPSMVALMTSRRLAEERLDVPADLPTLAESFQRAGWKTAGFIMNDIVSAKSGFARGFGPFEQMVPYDWELAPVAAWIETHAAEPTFTYVHLNEPHDPYLPPEPWRERLLDPDPVGPERLDFYRRTYGALGLAGDLEADVAHIERELGGYVDDVRYTDGRIAELLAVLDRAGLSERTCVVITADHGEGLWTRVALMTGQRRKALEAGEPATLVNTLMPTHGNQVNWELAHVPLIVRSPGLPAGRVVEGPVELIDVFPTLLELCDLPLPDGLAGASLVPRIERGRSDASAFTYTRFNSSLIAPDGWQLILPTPRGECEEGLETALYDLSADPEARVNLAAEHPQRVEQMSAEIVRRLQSGVSGAASAIPADILQALNNFGYFSAGIVDQIQAELLAKSASELAGMVSDGESCLVRLEAARALAARRGELDEAQLARLRARLEQEPFAAVRAEIEALLSP